MAQFNRQSSRGGLGQLGLAALILAGVATYGGFGDTLRDGLMGKKHPVKITTLDAAKAKCAANTVDTIIGTIGCGSTKKGARIDGVTFVSAARK
jgi:hypothetical protein